VLAGTPAGRPVVPVLVEPEPVVPGRRDVDDDRAAVEGEESGLVVTVPLAVLLVWLCGDTAAPDALDVAPVPPV
jgi:hypothetical protein